jgi:hypothetical protein
VSITVRALAELNAEPVTELGITTPEVAEER